MSGKVPEPITVVWPAAEHAPRAFVWRGRRWRVDRVVQRWSVDTGWWNERLRVDRRYLRVMAGDRVFDLCYDRRERRWQLDRVL